MESKLILLCFFFLLLNSEARIYQPDEFINITKRWIYEQEDLENIKKNLSIIINDYYAFNQIAKNPPQPNFDSNYHNQVDIIKELSSIQTKDKDIYTFYRDIKKIFAKTKDWQFKLDIGLNKILNYIYLVAPVVFSVNTLNYDEIKIVVSRNYLESHTLDPAIEEIINKNAMKPVKSINGKNPFDFISEFGNNYLNFRSPHANFALKSEYIIYFHTLTNYPFSYEELSKLNVVYESGDNFTINYLLMTGLDLDALQIKRNFLLKSNIKKESNYHFTDINKIQNNILERDSIELNKNILNSNIKIKDFSMYIDWDYEFSNIFKCRVDNERKINVYCINNFRGETSQNFRETLLKCATLFDNNTYPIVLIGNLNEGASIKLYHFFLEILSPYITSKIYTAFRKTEGIMKSKDLMAVAFPDVEKCEDHPLKDYFNKVNKVNYGNGITDELSEIFLYDGKEERKNLEQYKLKLKNKRKPTDIVVIADGYSFSTTSILLKYLQYYGGGITVGIYQHPNKKDDPFDSSTSPSPVFAHKHLIKYSEEYRIMNEKYNFKLQLSTLQTFYNASKIDVPLEYEITPVDEIEEIYELMYDTDSYYPPYIDKALEILKKYETECNPKNKKLVKVTNECDHTFENKYTHGGYECGDDGYWSTKCVASYCDLGYIFDYSQGKCIIDYCSDLNKDEGNNKKKMILIIVICSCIFALIIAIIIIAIVINYKRKKDESDYEDIAKISLSIQDRTG